MATQTTTARIERLLAIRDELRSYVTLADSDLYGHFLDHFADYVTDAQLELGIAESDLR